MQLVVTALAAWRLAHLLVHEDGPGAVFARLRYRAGVRAVARVDDQGQVVASRTAANTVAEGLTCVWCVSVWAAALLSLPGRPVAGLRGVLAVSAGAILVQETVARLRGGDTWA